MPSCNSAACEFAERPFIQRAFGWGQGGSTLTLPRGAPFVLAGEREGLSYEKMGSFCSYRLTVSPKIASVGTRGNFHTRLSASGFYCRDINA